MLRGLTAVGGLAGLAAAAGAVDSRIAFGVCYLCMLSLDLAMGMGYPWDCYLIETNVLCVFFPALLALPGLQALSEGDASGALDALGQADASALGTDGVVSPLAGFLWRWLAYRLMFGFGKLKFTGTTDKDDLYIKSFWVNMPMTTVLGWAGQALPDAVHIFNLAVMWLVEMVVPFMYFLNGWPRVVAAFGVLGLQVGIHATGNFGWFNVLSAIAAIPLLLHTSSVWAVSFGDDGVLVGAARGVGTVIDSVVTHLATCLASTTSVLTGATGAAAPSVQWATPAAVHAARTVAAALTPLQALWVPVSAIANSITTAAGSSVTSLLQAVPWAASAVSAVSYSVIGPSEEFPVEQCSDAAESCALSPTGAPPSNTLTDTPAHAWLWLVAMTIILPASLWHLPLNSWVTGGFTYWPALTKLEPRWFWDPLIAYLRLVGAHWRLVHAYGVFPPNSSPGQRLVPVFEGSADGTTWRQWEYAYMASHAKSRPVFVAPHTPRLDHSIFYDSLGINGSNHMMFTGDRTPWGFAPSVTPAKRLAARLLEGANNPVYRMFASNPFPDPDCPPKFVRVSLYRLVPTDPATVARTGEWWRCTHIAEHLPAISQQDTDGIWAQWLSAPEQWFPTSQVWRERVGWTRRGVTAPEYASAWKLLHRIRQLAVEVSGAEDISPALLESVRDGTSTLSPEHMASMFSYGVLARMRETLLKEWGADALHDHTRILGAMVAPLMARLTAVYGRVVGDTTWLQAEVRAWEAWREAGGPAHEYEWGSPVADAEGEVTAATSNVAPGLSQAAERKLDVFAQAVMVGIGDEGAAQMAARSADVFISAGRTSEWRRCWAHLKGLSKQPAEGVEPNALMSTPLKLQCYAHYLLLAGGRRLFERAVGGEGAIVGGHSLPLVWPPPATGHPLSNAPLPACYAAWAASPPPLVQVFLDTACPAVNPGCWRGEYEVGFFLEALLNYDSVATLAEKWRLMESISRKSTQADPAGGILPCFMEVVTGLRREKSLRPWSAFAGRRVLPTIMAEYDPYGPTGEWVEVGDGRKAAGRDFGGEDVVLPWHK